MRSHGGRNERLIFGLNKSTYRSGRTRTTRTVSVRLENGETGVTLTRGSDKRGGRHYERVQESRPVESTVKEVLGKELHE